MMSLATIPVGSSAKVPGFRKDDHSFRRKLLSMGLTPGAIIKVIRVAPLGDPLQLHVRGVSLTLRRSEADTILVEKV
jgi:ferrous iron transport protein A